MKKLLIVFAILLVGAGALMLLPKFVAVPALPKSGDRAHLEQQSMKFMEDLRFKDFQHAASYHSTEDRKKVNIPAMIENTFHVKPEQLDIMRYRVLDVAIDSTGRRGRVKVKSVTKVLNVNDIQEPELLLYWFKDPTEGWVMELESSLH
jgi:hypothetical protein